MNIFLMTRDFPPAWPGGIGVFLENICAQLQDRGHQLEVLAESWTGDREFDTRRTYPVYRYPVLRRASSAVAICKTIVYVLRYRPDLVFLGHFMTTFALGCLLLRKLLGIPYVILIHGLDLTFPTTRGIWVDKLLARIILRNASLVFTNSEYTKRVIVKTGYPHNQIRLLNPGVDVDIFRPGLRTSEVRKAHGLHPDQKVILTVARLVPTKNIENVLQALPQVIERVQDLRYLIVGQGPEAGKLERLVSDLGLKRHATFAGRIDEADLPRYYCASDLFVMPSCVVQDAFEGFGIVYIEASACAKPIVASKSGGIPDAVLDGVTGLLVDPMDIEEIGDALIRLLSDTELSKRLGENGRRRVEREFSWEKVGERVVRHLSELFSHQSNCCRN